jgi:hypothetical protein
MSTVSVSGRVYRLLGSLRVSCRVRVFPATGGGKQDYDQ